MAKLWFTSDTHFDHDAIRALAGRPFGSVAAMNAALIANWNAAVAPDDTVWHLGDVTHRQAGSFSGLRAQLNGTIHLVAGNHDQNLIDTESGLFASIQPIKDLRIGGQMLVLCHYPMREWHMAWRGAWHLFGHVHGRLEDDPLGLSLDVGVDSHGFAPIDFDTIARHMAQRVNPFVDPVGPDGRRRRPAIKTIVATS
jgi:calcineurin-like phosphoesterase family protein